MSKPNEPGLDIDVTIDGTAVVLPRILDPHVMMRKSYRDAFNGMPKVRYPYDGDGLPDQPDRYEFALEYDLGDAYATTVQFLEELRTAGGIHTFAYWKKATYRWTGRSGQQVFYLPRPDAYSKNYANHNVAADKPVVKLNGTPIGTVNTGSEVTSSTVVTAGQVSISNTSIAHPETGKTLSLFKFGTALTWGDVVRVEYHQLFNVDVKDVATRPFQLTGREDKALYLVETN